jgi:hypothetical protein
MGWNEGHTPRDTVYDCQRSQNPSLEPVRGLYDSSHSHACARRHIIQMFCKASRSGHALSLGPAVTSDRPWFIRYGFDIARVHVQCIGIFPDGEG